MLLSLLEFYHYKQYIKTNEIFVLDENNEKWRKSVEKSPIYTICMKDHIPQSHIVVVNKWVQQTFIDQYQSIYDKYYGADSDSNKFLFECLVMSYKLFVKYIQTSAATEINISSIIREELISFFGKGLESFIAKYAKETSTDHQEHDTHSNIHQFYHIFDECCDDMLKLLNYSFDRFKLTPLFIKLMKDGLSQQ